MIEDQFAATLFDAAPDGLIVADKRGAITLVNDAAAQMFGYTSHQMLELNIDTLVPSERRTMHRRVREKYTDVPTRRAMGTGLSLLAQHRDGSLFPVEISLSPVDIDGQIQTIAAVRDVSQRQADAAQLALLRDRERIARDIHDMVIQRLFGAGLGLQAVLGSAQSPVVAERLAHVIDELDETIRQLRTAIFQLTVHSAETTVTEQIQQIVSERSKMLVCEPDVSISDDVDDLSGSLSEQLVATLGEALANVARHAEASECAVVVETAGAVLRLTVTDNGVGLPEAIGREGGLANMRERASMLRGACTVNSRDDGGTVVAWSVPI